VRDVGVHDMHENEEVLERVVGVLAEDDLAQIVVEEVGGARAFRLRFVAQIKTRVLVAGVGGRWLGLVGELLVVKTISYYG